MPGLSGAALEARDRLVDTSLETNKQTRLKKNKINAEIDPIRVDDMQESKSGS